MRVKKKKITYYENIWQELTLILAELYIKTLINNNLASGNPFWVILLSFIRLDKTILMVVNSSKSNH